VSTKSNGGLNLKPDFEAKKMLSTSAKQTKRSLLYTIYIYLENQRWLQSLQQRRTGKKRVLPLRQKPRQKDYHKRKETSLNISRMIPA